MPELPEVETVKNNLNEIFQKYNQIESWKFLRADLRGKIPKTALNKLVGFKILKVERRAKYLLIYVSDGSVIISHLGMTGHWRLENNSKLELRKHDHILLGLFKEVLLIYNDPRRFGFIEVVQNQDRLTKRFANVGVEPLVQGTDFDQLTTVFKKLKSPIKSAIMNQKYVVGVGNIYASEILFKAQVHPLKICSKLSDNEYKKIWKFTKEILKKAIEKGGSSIENYKNSFGEKGQFQNTFKVYNRAGLQCSKCGELIKSMFLAGRSTYWCEKCQIKNSSKPLKSS